MALPAEQIKSSRKKPARPSADMRKEYVAGGSIYSANTSRTLPQTFDDVARQYGPDTYECMLRDPDVSAGVWFLINSTLADGIQLGPAVNAKDKQFGKAVDIAELCERSLCNLQRPFRQVLEDMLEGALAFGHKVAEKNYQMATAGKDRYKLVFSSIKVKPRRSVQFVVDEFMNVLGFASHRIVNRQDAAAAAAVNGIGPILPREKFAVLTLRSRDEDPRGTSSLLPAVNSWNLKQLTLPEYFKFLCQYALASLIAVLPAGADDEEEFDDQGEPLFEDDGVTPKTISATDVLGNQLERFRGGTYLIVKHGTVIQPIEVPGEGEAFREALKLFGNEITRGILLQTQATRESEHGTKAEGVQKMSVLEMLVWWLKGVVADMIRRDILRPLVRYNFGDAAAEELLPTVSLGDSERHDWAVDASAAAKLAPYLTDSQWDALTTSIGIAPPEEGEERPRRISVARRSDASDDEEGNDQGKQGQGDKPKKARAAGGYVGPAARDRFVSVRLSAAA